VPWWCHSPIARLPATLLGPPFTPLSPGTVLAPPTHFGSQAHFFKPKTLKLSRRPRYERSLPASAVSKMDKYAVIKAPLATDAAMQKIETHNTLVFLCDVRASKTQIRAAVKARYDVEVAKVNTLIRPDGQKKAYVRLAKDHDALDLASKLNIV
jgi:large subunit ribosomal protein L23Ae